jgi:sporulation-control protein spo0M
MAKCDLSIELNDGDAVHLGGGTISGVVRVKTDANVRCNGLEVRTVWKTHGRGNVASDTCDTKILFTGDWTAGHVAEYPFELEIANWPPTYHGNYLNVDHYVEAQVDIPWAFDPKASQMFLMRPTIGASAAAVRATAAGSGGFAGTVLVGIVGLFMAVFCVLSATNPIMLVLMALIAFGAFLVWFVRSFLPKFVLGEIDCKLVQESVSPGDSVQGTLLVRPRRTVSINAIEFRFEAREECVSGSGSNKKTHRHVLYEKVERLEQATTLLANQPREFPFSVQIPADAPYSVDLSDNDLIWRASLRVDIPRWPDWQKELNIAVVPNATSSQMGVREIEHVNKIGPVAPMADVPLSANDGSVVTFAETANHVWSMRDNNDAATMLAEAVTGLSFMIEAKIERRLLYSGEDDPHVYPNGYAIWAHYTDPPLPLALYVPHELGDEFEQAGQGIWKGQGTIVGWDHVHRRLQIRVDPA